MRITRVLAGLLLAGSLFVMEARAQSRLPWLPAPAPAGPQSLQTRPARVATWPVSTRAVRGPQAAARSGYPRLNAPLYPTPRQNVPVQAGGTMITNEALAPHELLYAHQYRSLYGPFYYRVRGDWIWTPFGIESHDKWELMGTEVKVKYRSNYSFNSLFMPRLSLPFTR